MSIMNVAITDKQIKQLSLVLSINDVLNCIKNDYDSYLSFINEELENKEITEEEYNRELKLLEQLKTKNREEIENEE